MIGRRLERNIQGDFQTVGRSPGDEPIEIVHGPESGLDRRVPALSDPIAHGLPGSSGSGVSELLRPLRKLRPMGCTGGR